jgi:K+-transporting ATPase KdpF subunit
LPSPSPTRSAATFSEEASMLVEYVLGGIVTAALLVYLTYALLRPERF